MRKLYARSIVMSAKKKSFTKRIAGAVEKTALKHFKPYTSAIITVGGSGTRMQTDDGRTKQFMELDGLPVIARTLLVFDRSQYIDEIIIVSKENEIGHYAKLIKEYGLKKISRVVKGGATRQESVLNGFKAISEKSDYVAIHDGVRCLITPNNIREVVKNAYAYGCACAATKSVDTVKIADSSSFIDTTPDRSTVWQAQTPQVFKADVYRACAFSAKKEGASVTDDCMLAERYGFKIKLVDCGKSNLKITTKEDLAIAEAILKMRKAEGAEEQL